MNEWTSGWCRRTIWWRLSQQHITSFSRSFPRTKTDKYSSPGQYSYSLNFSRVDRELEFFPYDLQSESSEKKSYGFVQWTDALRLMQNKNRLKTFAGAFCWWTKNDSQLPCPVSFHLRETKRPTNENRIWQFIRSVQLKSSDCERMNFQK